MSKVIKRNRRQRKKLYLDEFAVKGFEIDVEFKQALALADEDIFWDNFVDQTVDKNDLLFIGSSSDKAVSGFLVAVKRYESPTPEQRQAVADWLSSNELVGNSVVGELVDANYSD